MFKIARTKSQDPVQEALRSAKDAWNAKASTLIAQLIAFKRGLNGRGDGKAGLPPSRIKDPLPSEVSSYLNQMASAFDELVHQADSIISAQSEYAEKRNKGHGG